MNTLIKISKFLRMKRDLPDSEFKIYANITFGTRHNCEKINIIITYNGLFMEYLIYIWYV